MIKLFFFKNRKKLCAIALFSMLILWAVIPRKITLTPELSQLVFVYDSEDSGDVKEQVSYTLGNNVARTVSIEKESDNIVFFANEVTFFKWLKDCKKNCSYADTDGIETGRSYVKVKCYKEEVPERMIDADEFIRYNAVKQLFYGNKAQKISIKVEFIEKTTGKILISAEWPKEEYNIDRDTFFNEN